MFSGVGRLGLRAVFGGPSFSVLSLFANGEQGVWYQNSDFSTLFQDAAGTTPVTALEQPVGLRLDKRNAAYSVYFDGTGDYVEMPNSAAFDVGSSDFTIECWIYNGTTGENRHIFGKGDASAASITWYFLKNTSNKLVFTLSNTSGSVYSATSSASLPLNAWTHVAFVRNGNTGTLYVNGTADGTVNLTGVTARTTTSKPTIGRAGEYTLDTWNGYISNLRMVVGTAVYTSNFTVPTSPLSAIANTVLLSCGTSWSGNPVLTRVGDTRADKLNPFNTGTGNHAFQTTNSARPVLSARYNLLTQTEDFSSADWAKVSLVVATPTAVSADEVSFPAVSSAGDVSIVRQAFTSVVTDYIGSIELKAKASGDIGKKIVVYINAKANPVAVFHTLTDSYVRVTVSDSGTATTGYFSVGVLGSDYGGQNQGAVSINIRRADLRAASESPALPAYQRVGAATYGSSTVAGNPDYDAVGFPPYLIYDGGDWFQTSSINFTATDKMSVFAGVRKLSDTANAMLLESSAVYSSNPGTFGTYLPTSGVFNALINGNPKNADGANSSAYPAPTTNIISTLYDFGRASAADELSIRVNAVYDTPVPNTKTQTGVFGNYPLYIGARAGTSLFYTGRDYGFVIVGRAVTASELTNTEDYMDVQTFGKNMTLVYSDELTTALGELITAADGDQIYMSVSYV